MPSAQYPYTQQDLNNFNLLFSFGYNPQMPNSYQSQQALILYQDALNPKPAATPVGQSGNNTDQVGQASYSGIVDPDIRKALEEKALATALGNPERAAATNRINQLLTDFSKSSAFADSRAAADYNIQKALEAFAPGMTRGMQAAGQSGSSMQALMTERAATDAAITASLTQAQTAKDYGNISATLASPLERITQTDTMEEELALKAAELLKTQESQPVSTANLPSGVSTPGAPNSVPGTSTVGTINTGNAAQPLTPMGNWYFGYGNNTTNFKPF